MTRFSFRPGLDKRFGGAALGGCVSLRDVSANGKAVPVLHQRMAHISKLRLLAVRLAVEPGVRIGRALMGFIRTLLIVEILAVSVLAVLGLEALVAGPGLDERPVDGKMLGRQKRRDLRMRQERRQKMLKHIAIQQAVAVLRKRRGVPDPIIGRKPHEPPEQEVVVHLLHQHALRTNAVKRLQKQRRHQLFGRDRGTALARVKPREARAHRRQNIVQQRPDRTQRMLFGNTVLRRNAGKHPRTLRLPSPHRELHSTTQQN